MYYALLNFIAWSFVIFLLLGLVWAVIATPCVWLMGLLNSFEAKTPPPVHVRCLVKEEEIKRNISNNQRQMDEVQRKWKEKMADSRGLW